MSGISANAPAPATVEESRRLFEEARAYVQTESVTGVFITADVYDVAGDEFTIEADVSEVLDQHGPGVYTVQVWATLDDDRRSFQRYRSSTRWRCRRSTGCACKKKRPLRRGRRASDTLAGGVLSIVVGGVTICQHPHELSTLPNTLVRDASVHVSCKIGAP